MRGNLRAEPGVLGSIVILARIGLVVAGLGGQILTENLRKPTALVVGLFTRIACHLAIIPQSHRRAFSATSLTRDAD